MWNSPTEGPVPAGGADVSPEAPNADLAADQRIVTGHRFHAVRAHLLEMAGDHPAAR